MKELGLVGLRVGAAVWGALQLLLTTTDTKADFFNPTASMGTPREFHTVTSFNDGWVLAAGGWSSSGVTATAEVYHPASGWGSVAAMPVARYLHTATLISYPKVMVIGGWDSSSLLASAYVYDLDYGTWASAGSMSTARYAHTATLLANGKVLVTGGLGTAGTILSSVQLYDPASGSWSTPASMSTARYSHTATLLPDGKVLIAGGYGTSGALATAEIFNPAGSGSWTNTGSMPVARYYHTASLLLNGKVLVAAGYGSSVLSSAALYNPSTGTWTTTGSMSVGRYYHGMAALPDGKVLVAGGLSGSGNTSSAEVYDFFLGIWASTGSLHTGRYDHTLTTLMDGTVLVAGGGPSSYTPTTSCELYIPAVSTWTVTSPMGTAREFHTATLLSNGKVLAAGGWSSSGVTASAELYSPATGWSSAATMPVARYYHTATWLQNGNVLLVGGYSSSSLLASTALYNPNNSWSTAPSMTTARYLHTATLLPNGKVLVTGGSGAGGSTLSSVEVYNPSGSGSWSAGPSMSTARYSHTATLLANGKVLIAGGFGSGGSALSSTELYNPAGSGSWSAGPSIPVGRCYHTATLLPDGKVLVAAGLGVGNILSSAAIYDPAVGSAGTWSAASSMHIGRYYHTAVSLPDGKVLVAGGLSGAYNTASVELYDPSISAWTTTGWLNVGRYDHTATTLPNGKVLVVGGGPASYTPMTSSELYAPFLIDPKSPGGFAFNTVFYASTGAQRIPRYTNPTTGYAISRRLDISDFYNYVSSSPPPTGWGFNASSVPINGILKLPVGNGPFPLAIFAHGNHDQFDYSDEGYVYLCELLASWGILAASLDANFINEGSGAIDARGILQLEHVRQFKIWNETSGHPLYGKVNTNAIMLVGHSNGGEGAAYASRYNMLTNVVPDQGGSAVPLDGSEGLGPYGFGLKAVVGIAPSDGAYLNQNDLSKIKDNYMVIHGSRDDDQMEFPGYRTYDRAHPIDLANPTQDATGYKALLWAFGANHNYFNTTWDNEFQAVPTLSREEHEIIAKVHIGAMAQASLLGRTRYLELLKDHDVGKYWLPWGAKFISQFQGSKRIFINHYEEENPSVASTLSPPSSGTNSWSGATATEMSFNLQNQNPPHLEQRTLGVKLSWTSLGGYYQTLISGSGLNASAYQYLAIRIGQSSESSNLTNADQNLSIAIQDTNGGSATYTASALSRLLYPDIGGYPTAPVFVPPHGKTVMQTLRLPLNLIRDRVNINNISVIKLALDQVSTGIVYLDELQLTN